MARITRQLTAATASTRTVTKAVIAERKNAALALIQPDGSCLDTLCRYVGFIAIANLLWEFAQLPLYTIWSEGSVGENLFAAVHCTGGDVLISVFSLLAAIVLVGDREHRWVGSASVVALTLVFGVGYTVFSEWLNVEVRGSWAYSEMMPTLPFIGTGAAPLAQWIVIPLAAFWWAHASVVASKHMGDGGE